LAIFNTVIEAIEMLKRDKSPSREVTDTFGYEELESDLVGLLDLLRKMKEAKSTTMDFQSIVVDCGKKTDWT